jgi:hypothetical protein
MRPQAITMMLIEFVYMILLPLLAVTASFKTVEWKDRKIRS